MNDLLSTFADVILPGQQPTSNSGGIPDFIVYGANVISIILIVLVAVMMLAFVVVTIVFLSNKRKQRKIAKAADAEKKATVVKDKFEESVEAMPLFIGITTLLAFLVKMLHVSMESFNDYPVGFTELSFPFVLLLIPIALDIAALVFGCLKKREMAKSFLVVAIAVVLILGTLQLGTSQFYFN